MRRSTDFLIDKTNMTPARILVLYVVIGTILGWNWDI